MRAIPSTCAQGLRPDPRSVWHQVSRWHVFLRWRPSTPIRLTAQTLRRPDEVDRLVILHPHANRSLHKPLQMVLDGVAPAIRQRIKVAYVEECLERLKSNTTLPDRLRLYASQLIDKYVV